MGTRFWRSDQQQKSWRLFSFRIQAITCFLCIFSAVILLGISAILWPVAARCVDADQFWLQRYQADWPLGGTFFLIFFLLLVWNFTIVANQLVRGIRDWLLPTVNTVAIAIVMTIPGAIMDSAQAHYHERENTFGEWNTKKANWWQYFEDPCVVAKDYAGKWNVISKNVTDPDVFPAIWIELRPSLTFRAIDYALQTPYDGPWSPPRRRLREPFDQYEGEISLPTSYGYWDFKLEGDRLYLTSPEWSLKWYGNSEVVLERDRSE